MRLAAVAAVVTLALQAYPPPFPRDGATKVMDNGRVVVWNVVWSPGRATPMHEHTMDLVGVVLESNHVKVTLADGSVQPGQPTRPGQSVFLPKGVVHIEESVAGGRSIAIELKNEPPPVRVPNTSAPEGFPREGARLVIDNARVAIWDYTWLPGRPVALHLHNRDTVLVPVDAGEIRVQFRNGDTRISRLVPGDALFFSGADAHSEEASLGTPRAIVVELK